MTEVSMTRKTLIVLVLVLFCNPLRNADAEGSKWKTILTIAGAGGGFALGTFIGLDVYDDAINSDQKVWTTAALMAAGGGVAGYFIGRHMDNNRKVNAYRIQPEIPLNVPPAHLELENPTTRALKYGWFDPTKKAGPKAGHFVK
jgi:hypothetical protein